MAAKTQVSVSEDGETFRVNLTGIWTVAAAADLDSQLRRLSLPKARRATFDLSGIEPETIEDESQTGSHHQQSHGDKHDDAATAMTRGGSESV